MMNAMRTAALTAMLFAIAGFAETKESALGRSVTEDLKLRNQAVDDAVLRDYLAALANRLHASESLTIEIISWRDTAPMTPAALPGGYMIVPLSLLVNARDEDELVRHLAHSLAHLVSRHGLRQQPRGPTVYLGDGHLPNQYTPVTYEPAAGKLAAEWITQAGPIATGQFAAMQERARAWTPAAPVRRPPSLRQKP